MLINLPVFRFASHQLPSLSVGFIMAVELDYELLIDLIEERSCLWDLSNDAIKTSVISSLISIPTNNTLVFLPLLLSLHCQLNRKTTPRV